MQRIRTLQMLRSIWEKRVTKMKEPCQKEKKKRTGAVVVRLTREYQGKGHHLYVPNFYSSPYFFF